MKILNIFLRKKYCLSIIILRGSHIVKHKNRFFKRNSSAQRRLDLEIMRFRNFKGNSYADVYKKENNIVSIRCRDIFMKIEIEKIN